MGSSTPRCVRGSSTHDGLRLLRALPPGSQHLVLIDPPFDANLFEPALAAALAALRDNGLIYLEAPQAWGSDALAGLGLQVLRQGKAGAVHFHLIGRRRSA